MARDKVTLEEVAEAVMQLREDNEKVSIRNIMSITGGSSSTIPRLLAQFLDDEAQEEQFKVIGKELTRALLSKINAITDRKTANIRSHISAARELRDDAINELKQATKRSERCQQTFERKEATFLMEIEQLKVTLARTEGERDRLLRDCDELKSEKKDIRDQWAKHTESLAYHKGHNDVQHPSA